MSELTTYHIIANTTNSSPISIGFIRLEAKDYHELVYYPQEVDDLAILFMNTHPMFAQFKHIYSSPNIYKQIIIHGNAVRIFACSIKLVDIGNDYQIIKNS